MKNLLLNKEQIKQIIPYDDPFLFVHKVEKIEGDKIFGSYETSRDDYYFKAGSSPGLGVILILCLPIYFKK